MSERVPYPIPSHLSGQAQSVLAVPRARGDVPELDDVDGWIAVAEATDAYFQQYYGGSATSWTLSSTTLPVSLSM